MVFLHLVDRSSNEETNLLLNHLKFEATKIGQYTIRKSKMTKIFPVTCLPTILMNIINQATNYISEEDKCSLIYSINITCMMLLASVYISVSENLPVSFNIKPIEQWLLFNLFWPFLIIITNILLQVEAQHLNIPRNNISP